MFDSDSGPQAHAAQPSRPALLLNRQGRRAEKSVPGTGRTPPHPRTHCPWSLSRSCTPGAVGPRTQEGRQGWEPGSPAWLPGRTLRLPSIHISVATQSCSRSVLLNLLQNRLSSPNQAAGCAGRQQRLHPSNQPSRNKQGAHPSNQPSCSRQSAHPSPHVQLLDAQRQAARHALADAAEHAVEAGVGDAAELAKLRAGGGMGGGGRQL